MLHFPEIPIRGKLIGQVAKDLGINPRTLRYYENLRLLPSPKRSSGGYRLYDLESERRLFWLRTVPLVQLRHD